MRSKGVGVLVLGFVVAGLLAGGAAVWGEAMGTAFTYQGRLLDANGPANGEHDFQFTLYDANTAGSVIGSTITEPNVMVTGGVFMAELDFGAGVFTGDARWLEIHVRPAGVGLYNVLSPRQPVTPTPYALRALYPPPSWWYLTGNAGTDPNTDFLGTTDNQPLEFRVNGQRALRIEYAVTSNLMGGFASVTPGVKGATISGGGEVSGDPNTGNRVTDDYGTVGGGSRNRAGDDTGTTSNSTYATVGGGRDNTSAHYSTVGGGDRNQATGVSTVGGGRGNVASTSYATVGGGYENTAMGGAYCTVAGGCNNTVSGEASVVAGGRDNVASSVYDSIGGGNGNTADAQYGVVAGGYSNDANAAYATVGGGSTNKGYGIGATIAGGNHNTATDTWATVSGGSYNEAAASYATVGGGGPSNIFDPCTANRVTDQYGTVAGGGNNQAGDNAGTTDDAPYATVGGGKGNEATGEFATVAGGTGGTASGRFSFVGGGDTNKATGRYSMIPGGDDNRAYADRSFAAGRRAQIIDPNHEGTFLFADHKTFQFFSETADEFAVRCTGGARFVSAVSGSSPIAGVYLPPGGGSWSSISDRNAKDNYEAIDGREVLEKLAKVPVATWNYKSQDPSIRHIGPVAQDFSAAFGVGEDDKHIATVDADGVALAAIKGLHQVVKEKDAEIAALRARLEKLEAMVAKLTDSK